MAQAVRAAAAALAIALMSSCAGTPRTAKPCEDCVEGVATVKKNVERHVFCVIDRRQVDCTKNPPECPKCARAIRAEPMP